MATHSKVRTTWLPNQPVLHGEFAALDFGQFDSVSCSGGTYTPAAIIAIAGAGMTLKLVGVNTMPSGSLSLSGTAALNVSSTSSANFSGVQTYAGDNNYDGSVGTGCVSNYINGAVASFGSTAILNINSGADQHIRSGGILEAHVGSFVSIEGSATFTSGCTFSAACPTAFSGLATFTGGAAISGGVTVAGNFAITSGVTSLAGINHISGSTALSAQMQTVGSGRVTKRVTPISSTGSNSGAYGPDNNDAVIVLGLTANVIFTINDTNAVDGDEMLFVNKSTSNTLTINDPSAGTIIALKSVNGQFFSCRVMRVSGNWLLIEQSSF